MEGGPSIFSQGKGLLLQHGDVIESDWEYKDGRILPVKGGEILPFVPGKTWINIVPDLDALPLVKEKVFDDANR